MDPELKRWHDMNPEFKRFVDLYTGKVPDEEMWDAYARWRFLKRMEDLEMAEARAEGKGKGFAEGKAEGFAEGFAEGLAEGEATGLAKGRLEMFLASLPFLFKKMGGDLSRIGKIAEVGAGVGLDEKAIRAAYDEWLKTPGAKPASLPPKPSPRPKGKGARQKNPAPRP